MEQSVRLLDQSRSSDRPYAQVHDPNSSISSNHRLSSDLDIEKQPPPQLPQRWSWDVLFQVIRLSPGYLLVFVPRILQPGGLRRNKKKSLTPTSYLDALRGYAAWSIMNRHRFDLDKTWLAQQPIVRITHAGPGMVDLFFVISGYALSYRLLIAIHNREAGAMLESLASATFRRYLRLYLSVAFATFIVMLLVRLHCIDDQDANWYHMDRKPTFFAQFVDWARDVGTFSNPFVAVEGFWFEGVFGARYLYPTWTIPIEFRGSMVLFGFCAAVCKLSTRHRMMLCWITVGLCYYWEAIYIALFILGMVVADMSLERFPQRLKPNSQQSLQHTADDDVSSPSPRQSLSSRAIYTALFIAALFLLGGPPTESDGTPTSPFPWQYQTSAFPKWGTGLEAHFWPSIGAFLLVFALESCPPLQKPLTWNFSQYLGDLSFGIYLMHQIVMWTIYKHVLDPLREQYLGDSNWARTPGMVAYWMAVLWAAECFMRVDDRVVRLGRHIQQLMFLE